MTKTLKKIMYALLGLSAGLCTGALLEILMHLNGGSFQLRMIVLGTVIGLVYGAILGFGEGLSVSIGKRAATGGFIGGVIGIPAGILAIFFAQWLLLILTGSGDISVVELTRSYLPVARVLGWIILGLVLGTIEGLRSKSLRRVLFGLAGGFAGGLTGGVLFELLNLSGMPASAVRIFGFAVLGILIGTGLSIADSIGRFGILKVMNGSYKGKEFIINKNILTFGADTGCDVPLPGDKRIRILHGRIIRDRKSRGMQIFAPDAEGKIIVNDVAVNHSRLKYEDVIRCGSTVLRFIP